MGEAVNLTQAVSYHRLTPAPAVRMVRSRSESSQVDQPLQEDGYLFAFRQGRFESHYGIYGHRSVQRTSSQSSLRVFGDDEVVRIPDN